MKIFLDFDDVLFNTREFKKGLINVFKKNGVSEKDFLATYKDYPTVTKKGLQKYDPFRQIKQLEKKLKIDGRKTKEDMLRFLANCPTFVFRDIENFLVTFKKEKLFMISYGHTGFQDRKIACSGLEKYFSRIVVTDKMKDGVIKRFVKKNERFVFLDDRADQLNAVKKNFPSSLTFLVKRKEGRYDDATTKHIDYVVKNMREVGKILKRFTI